MQQPKIIVAIRKRPLSKKEIAKRDSDIISAKNQNTVIVSEYKYHFYYTGKKQISLNILKKLFLILTLLMTNTLQMKMYVKFQLDLLISSEAFSDISISGCESDMLCLWSNWIRKDIHNERNSISRNFRPVFIGSYGSFFISFGGNQFHNDSLDFLI